MSPCRAALTFIAILLALASSGCVVPGLGGSGGKTARAPGPGADGGAGGPEDISAFSPEVSMQRDLLQLREREAGQRETVENMRLALRQGGEDVQREEERLKDIQMQIERYDSAMRRYEMAGRYAVPAGGERGGEEAGGYNGYAGRGRVDNGYNADTRYGMGNAYAARSSEAGSPGRLRAGSEGGEYGREEELSRSGGRMGEGGMLGGMRGMAGAGPAPASPAGREEILYAGAYDPRLAEQPAPVGDLTLRRAAGRGPVQRRPMFEDDAAEGDVFAAPDAGAFAARAPAADVWSPPQPAPARGGAEQLAAAPAGRVQPTQPVSRQRARPGRGQPTPPAAAPEMRPAVPEDDGLDEVFTPDLFLSRR